MTEYVYRIMWRGGSDGEWYQHTGGSSNSNGLYTQTGAKVALTGLRRNRYSWARTHEYKIERSPLNWEAVDG